MPLHKLYPLLEGDGVQALFGYAVLGLVLVPLGYLWHIDRPLDFLPLTAARQF